MGCSLNAKPKHLHSSRHDNIVLKIGVAKKVASQHSSVVKNLNAAQLMNINLIQQEIVNDC